MNLPSGILSSRTILKTIEDTPTSCPDRYVVEQTEGPYYKYGSLERSDLVEDGISGVPFTLTGYVFGSKCETIAGAWIDFWQADGNGKYDNAGYQLRGHQFTGEKGKYTLKTVIPGAYMGRTNHIHVKLSRSLELSLTESRGSIVTTQLYFPGAERNTSDGLFEPSMVVDLVEGDNGQLLAFFNFKLDQ